MHLLTIFVLDLTMRNTVSILYETAYPVRATGINYGCFDGILAAHLFSFVCFVLFILIPYLAPNVDCVSGMSILDCSRTSVFSSVYLCKIVSTGQNTICVDHNRRKKTRKQRVFISHFPHLKHLSDIYHTPSIIP